jgi:K+/H+ antiporter YhaU regulatory subunit KhtT
VYNPGPDHKLEPGAELIVMGEIDDVIKLRDMMQEAKG